MMGIGISSHGHRFARGRDDQNNFIIAILVQQQLVLNDMMIPSSLLDRNRIVEATNHETSKYAHYTLSSSLLR